MPVQTSRLIESGENGKELQAKLRSHWIKVYDARGREVARSIGYWGWACGGAWPFWAARAFASRSR
jgi:hypothetical protein